MSKKTDSEIEVIPAAPLSDQSEAAHNKAAKATEDADKKAAKDHEKKQGPTVEPEKSSGKAAFDVESLRETEIFQSGDVVFVRQGKNSDLAVYPKHEAKTRFVEIKSSESEFKDSKTVTNYELANGDKVTIDGIQTIVTPKKGPANTDGPSLNVHGPDEN